jgi:hypothetical protein
MPDNSLTAAFSPFVFCYLLCCRGLRAGVEEGGEIFADLTKPLLTDERRFNSSVKPLSRGRPALGPDAQPASKRLCLETADMDASRTGQN